MNRKILRLLYFSGLISLAACASDTASVQLEFDGVLSINESGEVSKFYDRVANIDIENGVSLAESRTLSILGREDLIPRDHPDYGENKCKYFDDDDFVSSIVSRAQNTQIVIVNEGHARSKGRVLSLNLLRELQKIGYSYFGAEALSSYSGDRFAESTKIDHDESPEPFPLDSDGLYIRESLFGRVMREALTRDYQVFAYEMVITSAADLPSNPVDQVNTRDERQSESIYRQVFVQDPKAKLLLHVGYSHAREAPNNVEGREVKWLAARLKEKTGIDPLTINQIECRGGVSYIPAQPIDEDQAFVKYDMYVNLPEAEYERHRPLWRKEIGDVFVTLPDELRPVRIPYVVEARRAVEPDSAVPYDRVLVRPGEDVALALPPGKYRVRAIEFHSSR